MRPRQVVGWAGVYVMVLAVVPILWNEWSPSKEFAGAMGVIVFLLGLLIVSSASRFVRQGHESDGSAGAAYLDRNLAVLAWARTLHDAGHRVGWRDRGSDWPLLTMDLPTGEQVSYHLPQDASWAIPGLPDYPDSWDGHDLEEKQERVRRYLNGPTGGA